MYINPFDYWRKPVSTEAQDKNCLGLSGRKMWGFLSLWVFFHLYSFYPLQKQNSSQHWYVTSLEDQERKKHKGEVLHEDSPKISPRPPAQTSDTEVQGSHPLVPAFTSNRCQESGLTLKIITAPLPSKWTSLSSWWNTFLMQLKRRDQHPIEWHISGGHFFTIHD